MSRCYVTDCTEDGTYHVTLENGSYCPASPGGECDGHDYCDEHTVSWRKFGGSAVVSVRSVARKQRASR